MKILVDGDASPVNALSVDIAKKYDLEIVIYSNYHHNIKKYDYSNLKIEKVGFEPDSVDFCIANNCSKKDIVITQDYGLATLCLSKEAYPIHPKGLEYTNENILLMLEQRHHSKKSKKYKTIKKRTKEDDDLFKKTLITIIEKEITKNYKH